MFHICINAEYKKKQKKSGVLIDLYKKIRKSSNIITSMQVWIYVIPYLSYSKITARIRFCHEKKYLKNHIVFFFNRFNYFRVLDTGISVLKLWHLWGDSKNHFKSEKFTVASHRQYDPENIWGAKNIRKVGIMRHPNVKIPHLGSGNYETPYSRIVNF